MNKNLHIVLLTILRIISSFFLIFMLSRFLDKSTFGMYNYFIAFSTISLTILFNGFTPIYLRNKVINNKPEFENKNLYNQILFFYFILLILFNFIFLGIENIKSVNIELKLLNIFLFTGFFHYIIQQEIRSQQKFLVLTLILFLERFLFLLLIIFIFLNKIDINIIYLYVIFYVIFTVLILFTSKNIKKFIIFKLDSKIFVNFKNLILSYFKNTFVIITNNLANQSFLIFIIGFMFSLEKTADIAIAFQLLSIIIFSVIWVELILPIKYMNLIRNNNTLDLKLFFKNKVTKYFLIIILFSALYIEILDRTNIIEILFTGKYKNSINEIFILSIVAVSQCFEIFVNWYLLSIKRETTLMKISLFKLVCFLSFLSSGNYSLILIGFSFSFVCYFVLGLMQMKKHILTSDLVMIFYFYFIFTALSISNYLSYENLSNFVLLILIFSSIIYILINIKIYLNEIKKLFNLNGNNK